MGFLFKKKKSSEQNMQLNQTNKTNKTECNENRSVSFCDGNLNCWLIIAKMFALRLKIAVENADRCISLKSMDLLPISFSR